MKNWLIIVLLPLLVASTCKEKKGEVESSQSEDCFITKITELKQNTKSPPISVWSYTFKGEMVYYITYGCCDRFNELYSSSCELMCYPDGGITGKGDGKCPDFMQARSGGELIWSEQKD